MPFGIGVTEMVILLIVLLVFFGPKRLPEMGRSLGKGMREFKDSISGKDDDDEPVHKRYATELPPAEQPADPEYVDVEPPERDRVTRERDTIT
ncbi:MAG: twin-arginine translocase TatA/TatE family subunit [Actinobacteria bacterium]|nr:twin-arginine translocase TatA/TatE family subunit [Actinomycetota bacterium]